MIRVVLDTGVYVSAVIARGGPPDLVLRAWRRNAIEVVASPLLLAELERVLGRPKFSRYITASEVAEFIDRVRRRAVLVADSTHPKPLTRDPDDDYLVALAYKSNAVLVSGDRDIVDASLEGVPVLTPRQLIERLTS